jgi:hypothetical protein
MDARYEGPNLSRFLSEDPNFINAGAPDWVTGMQSDPTYSGLSGFVNSSNVNDLANPQNLNAYSYVDNRPLVYKDPDGKWGTPADVLGVGVGGVTYLYLYGATVYQNSRTGAGLFGILPTPAQTNSNILTSVEAGSVAAGGEIASAPLGLLAKALASGASGFSLLSGYDVLNGYISTGGQQPGGINWQGNAVQGGLSFIDEFLPSPPNIYLYRGRPTNLNKAIQPAVRDTIKSAVVGSLGSISSGSGIGTTHTSGGSRQGTFTFGGVSYPMLFSGVTTNGAYARM